MIPAPPLRPLLVAGLLVSLGCRHADGRVRGGLHEAFEKVSTTPGCVLVTGAHSLWTGDLQAAFFQHLAAGGYFGESMMNKVRPERMPEMYGLLVQNERKMHEAFGKAVDELRGIGSSKETELALSSQTAAVLAGIDAEVFRLQAEWFGRRYAQQHANPAMRRLLADPAMSCEVWVVDTVSELLLRAAATELGIPSERVHGQAFRVDGKKLADQLIHPSPLFYLPYLHALPGLEHRSRRIRAVSRLDDIAIANDAFPDEQKLLVVTAETEERLSRLADRLAWFTLE